MWVLLAGVGTAIVRCYKARAIQRFTWLTAPDPFSELPLAALCAMHDQVHDIQMYH